MCRVDPNNIGLLRSVAGLFCCVAFISVVSGKTYAKRLIVRDEEPVGFWTTVILFLLLGTLIGLGTFVCGVVHPPCS